MEQIVPTKGGDEAEPGGLLSPVWSLHVFREVTEMQGPGVTAAPVQ